MSRYLIKSAGILILIIAGTTVYIHHSSSELSEDPDAIGAAKVTDTDDNSAIKNHSDVSSPGNHDGALQPETSSAGKAVVVFHDSSEGPEPSSIAHIQRAFSGEVSVAEALRNTASAEGWSYDELAKNLMLWNSMCSAPESTFG